MQRLPISLLLSLPDACTGCVAGAEALGPQDAPGLPRTGAAAAPAPAHNGLPLDPDSPFFAYMSMPYPAAPRDLVNGPRGRLEAIGPGRCPNYVDQIRDTCPVPNLPMRPFPTGGPVGADPPLIAPPALTPAVTQMAASMGLLVVEMNATSTGKAAGTPVKDSPQVTNVKQLMDNQAMVEADRTAMESIIEQTVVSINTGDSWVIRNQNCGIAPIHAILNKVQPQLKELLLLLAACERMQLCISAVHANIGMALAACWTSSASNGLMRGSLRAQYNKLIMIDRTFYGGEVPNPTGIKASEYDVVTGANRDLTSGIQTNSWCSAVRTGPS